MKKKLFVLWLFWLAIPMEQYAQQQDVTHFINWFIADQKLDSLWIVNEIDSTAALESDFYLWKRYVAAEKMYIRQQIKKPWGKLKIKKIKGATILSNKKIALWQAANRQLSHLRYHKLYRPVFLPNNWILVVIDNMPNTGPRSGHTYMCEKIGASYRCRMPSYFNFRGCPLPTALTQAKPANEKACDIDSVPYYGP